jgi:transposase
MLTIATQSRLFFYQEAVSMRTSFEGLSAIVEEAFPEQLLSGAFFIFLNRKKDHMKVLYWDIDGLAIWSKRLEKGSFSYKNNGSALITRKEFFMLLEGIVPKRLQHRFSLEKK